MKPRMPVNRSTRTDPSFARLRCTLTACFLTVPVGNGPEPIPHQPHDEARQNLPATPDLARKRIEEAQLFVEAAHACFDRMG